MTRKQLLLAGLVTLVVLVVLFVVVLPVWLWHPLGVCSGTSIQVRDCKGYNFWSGSFADVGEITLIGAVFAVYRRHNCGAPRCWRIGKHKTADGLHCLCARHHPDLPNDGSSLSLEEIWKRHHDAQVRNGIISEPAAPAAPAGVSPPAP
jgi:hypothetical protein